MNTLSTTNLSYVSPEAKIGDHVSIAPTAIVGAGAEVADGCLIEDGVVIGEGAVIGTDTTIGAQCQIGPGALIGASCEISGMSTIGAKAVVSRHVHITASDIGSAVSLPKYSIVEFSAIGERTLIFPEDDVRGVRMRHCRIGKFNELEFYSLENATCGDRVHLQASELEVCHIGAFSNVGVHARFMHGLSIGERSRVFINEAHGSAVIGDDAIVSVGIMPRTKEQGVFTVADGGRMAGTIEPGDENE